MSRVYNLLQGSKSRSCKFQGRGRFLLVVARIIDIFALKLEYRVQVEC